MRLILRALRLLITLAAIAISVESGYRIYLYSISIDRQLGGTSELVQSRDRSPRKRPGTFVVENAECP